MTGGGVHEDQNRLATTIFLSLFTSLTPHPDTFSSFGHFRSAQGMRKEHEETHTLKDARPCTLTFKKGLNSPVICKGQGKGVVARPSQRRL